MLSLSRRTIFSCSPIVLKASPSHTFQLFLVTAKLMPWQAVKCIDGTDPTHKHEFHTALDSAFKPLLGLHSIVKSILKAVMYSAKVKRKNSLLSTWWESPGNFPQSLSYRHDLTSVLTSAGWGSY